MPIKSKPIDPQRAAQAAKGRLSSGGVAYAEQQARLRAQRRQWEVEEAREAERSARSASASSSSSAGSASPLRPARVVSTEASAEDSDEAAVLAAAQARTQRFLSAGNDSSSTSRGGGGGSAGLSEAVVRLATYEAAKRRAALRAECEQDEASPTVGLPAAGSVAVTAGPAAAVHMRYYLEPTEQTCDAVVEVEAPPPPSPPALRPVPQASPPSAHVDPLQRDFQRLMQMLAEDVTRERTEGAAAAAAAAAASASSKSAAPVTSSPSSSGSRPSTGGVYRPPAQSFAQRQADALLQLYEAWVEGGAAAPFLAAEHEAAAFAIAAASDQPALPDTPLSIEELAATEAALRSAVRPRLLPVTNAGGSSTTPTATAGLYAALSASAIAADASARLARFLRAVAVTEQLVRTPSFVAGVAAFLYETHRAFLPAYYAAGGTEKVTEHSHEEHAVYERFGRRVSQVLLRTLVARVPGFDEAEFIEALFDSPEEAYALGGAAGPPAVAGPQNVLSYPAWRILLSLSSFESFLSWMLDYIEEEYQLGPDPVKEGAAVVAVGGARGLRALIQSTYHRGTTPPPAPLPLPEEAEEAEGCSGWRTGAELPVAVSDERDATVAPVRVPDLGAAEMDRGATAAARPSSQPVQGSSSGPATAQQPLASASLSGSYVSSGGGRLSTSSPVPPPAALLPLREGKRFFPSPPTSAPGGALRPRNSHVGVSQRGKRLSATAARGLPPLEGSVNSPDAGQVRDAAQPALTSGGSVVRLTPPARVAIGAAGRSGGRSGSTHARSPSMTSSTARSASKPRVSGVSAVAPAGPTKPKLRREV